MKPTPIALFAYRRPEHTRQLLQSLLANPDVRQTQVYAFLDGPRTAAEQIDTAATRKVVQSADLPLLTVVERPDHGGLARSVIEGVTRVCAESGRVIVLEDDLVLAPTFLSYMNSALDRYQEEKSVYGISGFMFPVELRSRAEAVFLPMISSWGWGTWQRAWKAFDPEARGYAALKADPALRKRFDLDGNYPFFETLDAWMGGRNDSWAIRWYLSVFLRGGLTLFPRRSLVENHGFGKGGTHCADASPGYARVVAEPVSVSAFPLPVVEEEAFRRVKRLLGRDYSLMGRARTAVYVWLRRLLNRRSP